MKGLNKEVVDEALGEFNAALREKAVPCYLRQENQVAKAKAELAEIVARHREIDNQVRQPRLLQWLLRVSIENTELSPFTSRLLYVLPRLGRTEK